MRRVSPTRQVLPLAAVLLTLVGAVSLCADEAQPAPEAVPGELLVQFDRGLTSTGARQAIARGLAGATVGGLLARANGPLALVRLPADALTVEEAIARLRSQPNVVYAEPNYVARILGATRSTALHPLGVARLRDTSDVDGRPVFREKTYPIGYTPSSAYPKDNLWLNQWAFDYIGGPIIWASGERSAVVALVDTGVQTNHPDFGARIVNGWDFVNNDPIAQDDNGHGTMMAGLIAARANNGRGISGISNYQIYSIKAFDHAGYGTYFDIIKGLHKAASSAARVIVLSLASTTESQALRDEIYFDTLMANRVLVAPAGDDDSLTPVYPAAYATGTWSVRPPAGPERTVSFAKHVISVGAQGTWVTPSAGGADAFVEYCKAPYSNYGDWVSVVAPGTDIMTTTPYGIDYFNLRSGESNGGYNAYSGTAMAAALVAGTAARVWSVNPTFTASNVTQRLVGEVIGTNPEPERAFVAFTGTVDVDHDGTDEITACWDPQYAQSQADNPASTRARALADVNVAMGMKRSLVWGNLYAAITGQPVSAAFGVALTGIPSMRRESMRTGQNGNRLEPGYEIPGIAWYGDEYIIRVARPGWTNGPQGIGRVRLTYRNLYYQMKDVSLPPTGPHFHFVANWGNGRSGHTDLDLHLLFPTLAGRQCDVGMAPALATNPADYCGLGSVARYPMARLIMDSATTGHNTEMISVYPPLYPTGQSPLRRLPP